MIDEDYELLADLHRLNAAWPCASWTAAPARLSIKTMRRVPPVLKSARDNEQLG